MDDGRQELAYVDEHAVEVSASPEALWAALEEVRARDSSARVSTLAARLLGCRDQAGFRVARAEPPRELWLEGEHRFARYALRFHVDDRGGVTRLRAETRAAFPGLRGRAYRALVIGTGGHLVAVRWLLARIKRRAERVSRPGRTFSL